MLNRLKEQKDAILLVTPHFPKATRQNKELSTGEWDSLVPLVAALKVFEEVTLTASSSKVTTSEVISIINTVNVSIDRIKDYGNFKESLCQSLHRCYGDCENEPIYAFATILDPRFKNKIFRSRTMAKKALTLLIGELNALDIDKGYEIKAAENQEPTTPATGAVWSFYNQLINTSSVIYTAHCTMSDEVAVYLKEPLLASHEDVFEYWRKSKFLNMKKLAQKYLGTPLCTVFSERLFSTAASNEDSLRKRVYTFLDLHPDDNKNFIVNRFRMENIPKSTIYNILQRKGNNIGPERKAGSGRKAI
ncbi:zinc finger BED domain-containing protein 4-like [Hydra vulgaris]|uniref:Zinc finger BED domain-containing protein 4-like n=1 Tax=Hydra vulgaris TaxID=6087 RepID=A0ABM4CBJ9_HYDVU